MKLELHATPQEVMRAVDAVGEFCASRQIGGKTLFALTLALEECASNIVNHALSHDAGKTFSMILECTENEMVIELRDQGPEFDPTRRGEAALRADDSRPGGWGIQIACRYADQMFYRREGGENVLRLVKSLNRQTNGDGFRQ